MGMRSNGMGMVIGVVYIVNIVYTTVGVGMVLGGHIVGWEGGVGVGGDGEGLMGIGSGWEGVWMGMVMVAVTQILHNKASFNSSLSPLEL